jgi:hypothetical protein
MRGLNPEILSIDQYFDNFRHKNIMQLKSFVLDGFYLVHHNLGCPTLNGCLYKWNDKKVWEIDLDEDIKIF